MAASASSRNRRMRADSRDAYSVEATEPTSSVASTIENSRSNARLRSASTAFVVSSTMTAPRTWSPTQIGCAAETIDRPAVRRLPPVDGQNARQRTVDLARREQNAPTLLLA